MKRKKLISQVDGRDDFHEETSKVAEIMTLELDELGGIKGPKLPPNTTPPCKVLHLKAGIGHIQQELSTSCGDTFACYEFPDDPKAFIWPHGPNRGKHEPSLYDVFSL